jgi:hypothetical protein
MATIVPNPELFCSDPDPPIRSKIRIQSYKSLETVVNILIKWMEIVPIKLLLKMFRTVKTWRNYAATLNEVTIIEPNTVPGNLGQVTSEVFTCNMQIFVLENALVAVFRIGIRNFLAFPDPDQLVRDTDPDPDPSITKQK